LELRGFRARFWLLKPSAVNYVHVRFFRQPHKQSDLLTSTRSPSKTVTE
jgi:hypothetical protein